MAPRTRQQASGKSQPKLEELPTTQPVKRKRKEDGAGPKSKQPAEQKPKSEKAPDAHKSEKKTESKTAQENGKSKLADDKKALDQIVDKQANAEAAEQLKAAKHQPTLEQMPKTEGDPGPPKSAPDNGPKTGQGASSSKQKDVRKVENREVQVNRAPVITLWAAAVAQRQGFSRDASLTFGKYISGMLAQSKGRSIGIYEDKHKSDGEKAEAKRQEEESGVQHVDVFGMSVKAVKVNDDLRAVETNNKPSAPKATEGYLSRAFGDRYKDVEDVFKELAESFSPEDAAASGYRLYEKFRPTVPQGQQGWGAKGVLDLQYVLSLSNSD